ncbi:sensor histidine kinase [Geomesophilobacter sediminis]|uniref:histidine kinase n=1 Tax=Geomesophilobacter sediminis TaxID=2798584 RepID=A0A8J7JD59_9BACT|nr:PAS domain S-box protein [Geomesophilobacter sediminis]MBJ6723384.1 PAS domain S-box protein [Geomesophilobacter sediminis]
MLRTSDGKGRSGQGAADREMDRKQLTGEAESGTATGEAEAGMAVFFLDAAGTILSLSAARRFLGYPAAELVGRPLALLLPEFRREQGLPQNLLAAAFSEGTAQWRGALQARDQSRVDGEVTVHLMEAGGDAPRFSAVVSRRGGAERLDNQAVMLERLFEHSPDAVLLVDREATIRRINRQVESLFGFPREELTGAPLDRLIPERFHRPHRHHVKDYFRDPRTRMMGSGLQLFARRRDGGEFPVDIMLSPIEVDGGLWALAVVRDITERKRTEARINELNRELQTQVEQLGAVNRELEAFSYSVSHDLRAPVRHIGGYLQLLAKRDLSCLDPQSQRYLDVIMKATQDMGTLIDDLLSFSRMGRVDLMKSRVRLGEMVREVVAALAPESAGRIVNWEIGPLPEVEGDPAMLRLVLVNLLANALKFTRGRPRAVIEIGAVPREGEVAIFVRDNGVGFEMQYADKVFGLFQRLHRQDEFEGTGVGLANVQRIIARHGGRTWAEGALDRGATFWFTLPAPGSVTG